MYRLAIILTIYISTFSIASPLNLESDSSAVESFQQKTKSLVKQKEKSKTESDIKTFIDELEKQKETLFALLSKNAPKNNNTDLTPEYIKIQQQYDRLLEIYVAFEALKAQLQIPVKDRSCSQFEHDYSMSAGEDKNKYSIYQTTVLRLHNLICK